MPKNIQPLHDELTPEKSSFKDRSDLSGLYERKPESTTLPETQSRHSKPTSVVSLVFFLSLAVVTPYALSYFGISSYYELASSTVASATPSSKLLLLLLSVISVIPWLISFKIIYRLLYKLGIGIGQFILLYSFFIFPALKITTDLAPNPSALTYLVTYLATIVLSFGYLTVLVAAIRASEQTRSYRSFRWLFLIIGVMLIGAVIL